MKKLLMVFCVLCLFTGYSQVSSHKYYIYLNDYKLSPTFTKVNNLLVYSGTNASEDLFFKNKNLTYFQPAFEDAIDVAVKNVFYLETTNSSLVANMKTTFPNLYVKSDDITNEKFELLSTPNYYPNDYGSSSPFANLGANYNRKEWDYLNLPKAWGITTGLPTIKIGISDESIYYTDPDFLGKVTLVNQYSAQGLQSTHGNDVAATAAARGNNAYGSAGVCMDCEIVAGPMELSITAGPNLTYTNLYKMAKLGAKVINMSWQNSGYRNMDINSADYYNPERVGSPAFPILAQQLVINDLVNNFRVTLVAASGNSTSFGTPTSCGIPQFNTSTYTHNPVPYGLRYVYPASYDNVISVGSIEHRHKIVLPMNNAQPSYGYSTPVHIIHRNIEDSISTGVSAIDPINPVGVLKDGRNFGPQNVDSFLYMYTLNEKVDILAPGHEVYSHNATIANVVNTTSGTSFSAPTVSGTIGLMLSLNECLLPSEIEDILQLTTKDVENMPINQVFLPANQPNYTYMQGFVGAGKLEIGNAIEFTNEIKKINGNAVIKNHIYNRFNFNLYKINNNLSIENVTFKDACSVEFVARNQITLSPGTNLKPNMTGKVNLRINPNIDLSCSPIVFPDISRPSSSNTSKSYVSKTVLYPNPNNGSFKLYNIQSALFGNESINLDVYDLNGRSLFSQTLNQKEIENYEFNLLNLKSGVYIVKLSSSTYFEEMKFIKN